MLTFSGIIRSRLVTIILLVIVLLGGMQLLSSFDYRLYMPGNNTGYEPVQPVAYSHRLHAGELGIPCQYCHSGAERSRNAGIPAVSTCMNCHRFVTAPWNVVRAENDKADSTGRKPRRIVTAEIQKLYDALGAGDSGLRDSTAAQTPIAWVQLHNLPDFVYFSHAVHVTKGVTCQTCHGEVQTMERVRQIEDLSMGWCVNCHRDATANGVNGQPANAPVDCSVCHF